MLPRKEASLLKRAFKEAGVGGILPWDFFHSYKDKMIASKLSQYNYFSPRFVKENFFEMLFRGIQITPEGAKEAENYYNFFWFITVEKQLLCKFIAMFISVIAIIVAIFCAVKRNNICCPLN